MALISIIIASSSRVMALEATLRSLVAVRVPEGWSVELLLVENGTQSGAKGLLQRFEADSDIAARYLFEPIRGKSRALNLALSQADGEILLFSDDDVRFPTDWIESMCEPIVMGRSDAVAGGVRIAPHLLRSWMNHTHRAWLASTGDYLSPDDPSEMCGANMAVSRKVLHHFGGFDPELGPGINAGGEESLLSWQMRKAGFRLGSALEVKVEHHLDPNRLKYKSWVKAARMQGQTRAYLLHHWFHKSMRFPELMYLYHLAKLWLRKAFAQRRLPEDEGIPPWELSYIEEMETCANFIRERRNPRNYSSQGLRTLWSSQGTVPV